MLCNIFIKLNFISFQVPSFARRSSVLSNLHDASQDNGFRVKMSTDPTPMQQHHLNRRRQHPYHSQDDVMINGKNEKKQYYQLSSGKHHTPQLEPTLDQTKTQEPDPGGRSNVKAVSTELEKVLEGGKSESESKLSKESTRPVNRISSKLKIVENKNKNGRIVIVMSKYMENGKQVDGGVKQNEALEKGTNYTNGAVERTKHSQRNGFGNGRVHGAGFEETSQLMEKSSPNPYENTVLKRCHSEPSSNRCDTKSFLSCRSISTPNASLSPSHSNVTSLNGHHSLTSDSLFSDSCQDEPMDLSFTGSRGARNAIRDCRTNGHSNPAEEQTTPSTREPESDALSFAPFLGNIIITDVTANCLTVTFKEYVPA